MRYFWIILLVSILFSLPYISAAQEPIQEPESVQEPDAADEPDNLPEQPKNEVLQAPPAPKKPSVLPKPGEVAPIPNGDAGFDMVVLRGLNKVTARAQTIEAPIGSVVRFGTIEIVAHSCWKSAPEEQPENAALLEISEIRQGEAPSQIFLGWMFSSSPGLSSLENPFYDVTVVKCEKEVAEELKK